MEVERIKNSVMQYVDNNYSTIILELFPFPDYMVRDKVEIQLVNTDIPLALNYVTML